MQLQSKHVQPLQHKTSPTSGNDESKGLDGLLALDSHHLIQTRTKNIFRNGHPEKKFILPDHS